LYLPVKRAKGFIGDEKSKKTEGGKTVMQLKSELNQDVLPGIEIE